MLAILVVAGLYWGTIKSLDLYTKHGETITIPDLQGLTIEQAMDILKNKNLRYKINDSSTFTKSMLPYTILSQDPKPNAKAKANRTIYVSVNARYPNKVKMPDLIDSNFELAAEYVNKLPVYGKSESN